METNIPIFDLIKWKSANPEQREKMAADLDSTLKQTGMFLLRGHDVPSDVTSKMRDYGRTFFNLPIDQKKKYSVRRPYDNGWRGLGELQVGANYGVDNPPDLHEAYHVGPTHRTGDPKFDSLYYPDNKWPSELPELRRIEDTYTSHMVRVAHEMLQVFAEVLGIRNDFFTSQAERATWTQNVNWYPSRQSIGRVAEGQMRVGPHSDYGSLTLLDRQPGVGGLEVWNEQSGWFTPPYETDTLAVLLGDLMNIWTDGRWRPLRHRVLAPPLSVPEEELVSLVFFFEANPDARIIPLEPPIGGGKGRAAVIAGESILEKVGISLTLAS
jgi:validamycin A dioxygenase